MYEQEQTLYTFHHNDLTNNQWCKKFNTRSDVANSTGVTIQHKAPLENVAQEENDFFENITGEEPKTVRMDAEERYLAYVLL